MPTHRSKNSVDAYLLDKDETVVTNRGPVNGLKGQYVVNHLQHSISGEGEDVYQHDGTVKVLTPDEFDEQYGDYLDSDKPTSEKTGPPKPGETNK